MMGQLFKVLWVETGNNLWNSRSLTIFVNLCHLVLFLSLSSFSETNWQVARWGYLHKEGS